MPAARGGSWGRGVAACAVTLATALAAAADEATIEAVAVATGTAGDAGGRHGGWSDLVPAAAGGGRFFVTTDRGPNGLAETNRGSRRTLLEPGFVPRIFEIDVAPGGGDVRVVRTIPLAGRSGKPLSGRPNGIDRDEPMLEAGTTKPLAADADGVDPEGLVAAPDGTFWLVEEYRPSLLHVGADGRMVARFVPRGTRLTGADAEVHDCLPAAYARRADNRGFESLTISPDGTRLWAMLQSPLDNGRDKAVKRAGNVRLLAFDPAAGRPVAEHVYRLGDPLADGYATKGTAADGKLCALATLDATSLLTIEQLDTGAVRLYRIELDAATDTLDRDEGKRGDTLEEVRDLAAAGIRPVRKTLVADLTPLTRRMRRDVYGDSAKAASDLKLEGLAILDDRRVAIVNDNDFGVHAAAGERCSTCIWTIRLPALLTGGG